MADIKKTVDGREKYREYHRNYKRERRAADAESRRNTDAIEKVFRDSTGLQSGLTESEGGTGISQITVSHSKPVSSLLISEIVRDFIISSDSWR